jgi:two-component system, OmpR family, response regulator ResD
VYDRRNYVIGVVFMEKKTILIADDEERIRRLVADFLKNEGYSILEAENGAKAIEIFNHNQDIDLVILDVMMPEYDGWTVCKEIRKNSKVPIIILTAKIEESDELYGFVLGADEYITKPFNPLILVARINVILKRMDHVNEDILTYDGITIDKVKRIISINGERTDLSPKEYELLIYLVHNKGIALSRDQILNGVWEYDYFGDSRTVDTHIKRLRAKLGENCDFIETVRGFGYRFEALR